MTEVANEVKEATINVNYGRDVLSTNKKYKEAIHGSLGGVRAVILAMDSAEVLNVGLNPMFAKILRDSKGKKAENKRIYEFLKANVRVSKAGNYGIFFTVQSLSKLFKTEFEALCDLYTDSDSAKAEFITLSASLPKVVKTPKNNAK
jgi:hypothetical protein